MPVPNVSYKVEIAWTSTFRTPAVSRVWTDVSAYAELGESMTVTYGRADEISVADANQFNVTLDNKDGRFTPGNAASPYYPNVKIGKPIRLTATIGGVDYVRFVGYINEWPVEWPGSSDKYATVAITASSRLSRLGLDSPLVNAVDQLILKSAPVAYWPLVESEGPGLEVLSRTSSLAVSSDATFGAGQDSETPSEEWGGDGRTVVKLPSALVGGDTVFGRLSGSLVPTLPLSTGTMAFGLFVKVVTPTVSAATIPLVFVDANPDDTLTLNLSHAGHSTNPLGQAGVHFLSYVLEQTSPTAWSSTTYLDGGVIRSSSGLDSPSTAVTKVTVIGTGDPAVDILVGRLAVWDRVVTGPEFAAFAEAGVNLFSGDTTDERLSMLAGWAGIPSAEITTTASPVQMAGLSVDGGQIVSLMREVETTEAGVLYDDRTGNLVLKTRSARYGAAVALTLDASLQDFDNYAPKVDRQGLANFGKGTNTLGTVDVTYVNEASRDDYGDALYEVQTAALDPDEPLNLIGWQVNANAEPRPRTPAVTVNVINYLASPAAVLGLDIGSKTRIANAPVQAPSATADYFVEGYTETFGVGSWSMALNLSPAYPYDSVFILDSATDGVLDTDTILAI